MFEPVGLNAAGARRGFIRSQGKDAASKDAVTKQERGYDSEEYRNPNSGRHQHPGMRGKGSGELVEPGGRNIYGLLIGRPFRHLIP